MPFLPFDAAKGRLCIPELGISCTIALGERVGSGWMASQTLLTKPCFQPESALAQKNKKSATETRGRLSKSSVLWILFVVNILWVDPKPIQQPWILCSIASPLQKPKRDEVKKLGNIWKTLCFYISSAYIRVLQSDKRSLNWKYYL